MKISQLRQIIREEAKRALNEGPALSDDANNLIKRGRYLLQQISTSKQELSNLKTQYEKLTVDAGTDSINKIESALKSMFPPDAKITNRGDAVYVDLKQVKPRIIWQQKIKPAMLSDRNFRVIGFEPIRSDWSESSRRLVIYEKKFISDLEQKIGLPKSSIVIKDLMAINLYEAYTFIVTLTQNYKKTALNFPNWSDAVRA